MTCEHLPALHVSSAIARISSVCSTPVGLLFFQNDEEAAV
jgi:hypothetical protein